VTHGELELGIILVYKKFHAIKTFLNTQNNPQCARVKDIHLNFVRLQHFPWFIYTVACHEIFFASYVFCCLFFMLLLYYQTYSCLIFVFFFFWIVFRISHRILCVRLRWELAPLYPPRRARHNFTPTLGFISPIISHIPPQIKSQSHDRTFLSN